MSYNLLKGKRGVIFGAMNNKGYNRFRHFNDNEPDKVMPDFAVIINR
jgi:hypothetical protein